MDDKRLQFYAPIEKTDEEERMVYGYASTEALDSQDEIVKVTAMAAAVDDYMKYANIREMHQHSAVGKTKKATVDNKGLYIGAKVVDDNAWKKVKEGVYTGFSIGGRVKTMIGNEITGLQLSEISLVDRPANPEATFDVWKMEEKPKELKKSLWSADWLLDMACDLASYIQGEAFEGEDVTELKGALQTIKGAVVMELKENEDFGENVVSAVELAEKTLSLKKEAQAPKEGKVAEAGSVEPPKESTNQAAVVMPVEEKDEVTEEKEEVKEEVVEEKPAEPVKEPVKEDTKEEVKEEVKDEVKEEEKAEKTEMEKIDDKLKAGLMPTDVEIVSILKSQDIEPSENVINVTRLKMADMILKFISENHENIVNADFAKSEAEKAKKETPEVVAEKKHQFDEVLILINKFEKELKKKTKDDVVLPPQSQVQPMSPAETGNKILDLLNEAVKLIASQNQGNQLTQAEKDKLQNGVTAGSEKTSQDRVSDDVTPNPVTGQKAEQTQDLAKFESEILSLREEVKKLSEMPMPVKAYASYITVEKFDKSDTETAKVELEKAAKRADELHDLMKSEPNNAAYVKEAQELAPKIQKLQREVNSF